MRVLMMGHRKMDNMKLYDISTPEKERAAFLLSFRQFDRDEFYHDLDLNAVTDDEIRATMDKKTAEQAIHMRTLYRSAAAGDGNSAIALLMLRKRFGYEDDWKIEDVLDPVESEKKAKDVTLPGVLPKVDRRASFLRSRA